MVKLDHIAIASSNMSKIADMLNNVFGIELYDETVVESQNVKARFSSALGSSKLELTEPTSEKSPKYPLLPHPLKNFLEKNGTAIHHICLSVENIDQYVSDLEKKGIKTLFGIERGYNNKKIAFINPKDTEGILFELTEENG